MVVGGQQSIEHLSPNPSLEPWAMVCWFALASDPELSDPSIGSIWVPPPLSERSLLSWFAVSGKLFNFTEISSTEGIDLSAQGWVTIRANYRKCQSETVLPLWRPREEKKKFLTLIGTKPSPHGSFWGTDPSMSLVSVS